MASAAAPSFASTKETTNYARLCRLLLDVGTHVLRETFDRLRPGGELSVVLASSSVFTTLQLLRMKRVLNPSQWGKLFPAIKHSVSSKEFDITLLMTLLRNICNLTPPVTGWGSFPTPADITNEADIVRIKYYRNTIYGHANEASVDDVIYAAYWQDIKDTLVRLGGRHYITTIDHLEKESIDPEYEEHYQDLLRQWVKDEENIKDKLDEIAETLGKKLEDVRESVAFRSGLEKNMAEKLHRMECEMRTVTEKLHVLEVPKEENKDEDKFQQMENQLKSFGEKLDALMAPKEEMKDEENKTEKLEQMENLIQNVNEKLDTMMAADQSRAPLALGIGQYATGHEMAIRSTEDGSGNTAVNSFMNANVNTLGTGPTAAVFSGNTMSNFSINIYPGEVKFVQNDKKAK